MSDELSTLTCRDCGSVFQSSISQENLSSENISLLECPICSEEVVE